MIAAFSGMRSCLQVAEQHAVMLLERQQGYTEVQMRLAGDLRCVPPLLPTMLHHCFLRR